MDVKNCWSGNCCWASNCRWSGNLNYSRMNGTAYFDRTNWTVHWFVVRYRTGISATTGNRSIGWMMTIGKEA